jgi:hypothetical protein
MKAEPLVFQRDSAICEKFSKKVSGSRGISRKGFTSYANAYPVGRIGRILNAIPHRRQSCH